MRTVIIAPEVAELLGAEQVERLRSTVWEQRVQCWECDGWIGTDEPAAVVVLRPADIAGAVDIAVHAHPEHARSEIRAVPQAEFRRRKQQRRDAAKAAGLRGLLPDGEPSVDVVATTLDSGKNDEFGAVLISHRAELLLADSPGRVDGLVSVLLGQGWELFSSITTPPVAELPGWSARFTHEQPGAAAPGVFELIAPDGSVETSAQVQPSRLWRPAVVRSGRAAVVQGSRFLTDWTTKGRTAVKRAARAGLLVASVVPVRVVGPGNNQPGAAGHF